VPSPGSIATWENQAATRRDVLTYNVASAPQYYECYLKLPNLMPLIKPLIQIDGLEERVLVDVSYEAFLLAQDANMNSAGILTSQLGYLPTGAISGNPNNYGNALPNLDVQAVPLVAETYDPTSLPVGGVNYPIWTKSSSQPLTARQYADDTANPPSSLWGFTFVQLNASVTGSVVTIEQHIHWILADVDLTGRPLLGVAS
jgi:hypothetical protein